MRLSHTIFDLKHLNARSKPGWQSSLGRSSQVPIVFAALMLLGACTSADTNADSADSATTDSTVGSTTAPSLTSTTAVSSTTTSRLPNTASDSTTAVLPVFDELCSTFENFDYAVVDDLPQPVSDTRQALIQNSVDCDRDEILALVPESKRTDSTLGLIIFPIGGQQPPFAAIDIGMIGRLLTLEPVQVEDGWLFPSFMLDGVCDADDEQEFLVDFGYPTDCWFHPSILIGDDGEWLGFAVGSA